MSQSRHLTLPMTVLALLLMIFPMIEVFVTSLPMRIGVAQWRFGVEGLVTNGLFFPLIGILLLLAAAGHAESPRRMTVVFWVGVFMAVALLALMASFTLDALQLYAVIPAKTRPSFRHAVGLALARAFLAVLTLGVVAAAAKRMSREARPARAGTPESALIARAMPVPPIRPAL